MKALYICTSTHGTIRAERILRRHSIDVMVIPVPREVSSDCGMAIELNSVDQDGANTLFKQENIEGRWYAPDQIA